MCHIAHQRMKPVNRDPLFTKTTLLAPRGSRFGQVLLYHIAMITATVVAHQKQQGKYTVPTQRRTHKKSYRTSLPSDHKYPAGSSWCRILSFSKEHGIGLRPQECRHDQAERTWCTSLEEELAVVYDRSVLQKYFPDGDSAPASWAPCLKATLTHKQACWQLPASSSFFSLTWPQFVVLDRSDR